jgi:hypothetical protein
LVLKTLLTFFLQKKQDNEEVNCTELFPSVSFPCTIISNWLWVGWRQDETWAEFSTLEVAICMLRLFGVISKTAKLKVENSAQTTSRFSPISYRAPRFRPFVAQNASWLYFILFCSCKMTKLSDSFYWRNHGHNRIVFKIQKFVLAHFHYVSFCLLPKTFSNITVA